MITSSEEQTLKRAEHHLILHYIYIYMCAHYLLLLKKIHPHWSYVKTRPMTWVLKCTFLIMCLAHDVQTGEAGTGNLFFCCCLLEPLHHLPLEKAWYKMSERWKSGKSCWSPDIYYSDIWKTCKTENINFSSKINVQMLEMKMKRDNIPIRVPYWSKFDLS